MEMPHALTLVNPPASLSPEELEDRMIERRAVEAAIWGMPIVSVDAMRQAFLHEGKYGDILYCSRPADWKFQITTPNASSLYVYFNFNLKDGPVVVDFPAAVGAGLFGTILDAWQVPLADVGPEGDDEGYGGKYLLLPPDHAAEIPLGYFTVQSQTFNGYALFRAIPFTQSEADVAKAVELVKRLRVYPLSTAHRQHRQRHIDISGKLFDGIVRYDETFYQSLATMVAEEPVQTRDLAIMGQLSSLGITKDKPFKPNYKMKSILRGALAEVHATFIEWTRKIEPYWPGSQWGMHSQLAPQTQFSFQTSERLAIDERGALYFFACAPPRILGAATFYLAAAKDSRGEALVGGKTYRLHIPPNPPVKQYWAVTVYDLTTAGFIHNSPTLCIDSYKPNTEHNTDGSVDIYFTSRLPRGKENNWIYTASRGEWTAMFRFYGPKKAVFEKTWVLPNIEQI
jgi:hypothetical protein